ncbi:OLC1v1010101C2 [Oldenlandia corymbosa var. corymbosa]|uniref:Peroxidase n=1 Tax=Oldenlandia corymbosa var. corymbosa TaxID=529605 RepID=A0AAV1DT64_OLDCO|nr:OLC1v1010101C2 [Oldenlandia corymbosa var. corymbosa]
MNIPSAKKRFTSCFFFFFLLFLSSFVHGQLDYRFYDNSCPNLTRIVRYVVWSAISNDTRMAASLLRLHFHDCFVDGSVLLDDTSTMTGEKTAFPNKNSVRGFEVIDAIKANVEKYCPGTVSCTDILALAAREAVYMVGGPYWPVYLGRRDGLTAKQNSANTQLPSPFEPLQNITAKFTSKGLDVKDVVVLSGGHTIGFAQCFTFKPRLFNFDGAGNPDPTLDATFLTNLRTLCPNQDGSDTKLAPLDANSINRFDNFYYKNLVNNTGLLMSDQALMGDDTTASMVYYYSKQPYLFYKDFSASMVKMGNIGVLTGNDGEIRKNCRVRNSYNY